jgi:O-antigen ligase
VLAVLALGWIAENRQERLLLAAATFMLLVGLFATASRAGVIAFAVGLGWLAVGSRGRVLLLAWPVVLGALLSTATLMPSMVASHSPRPLFALCGLVAGLGVSIAPHRVTGAVFVAAAVALFAVPGVRTSVTSSLHQLQRNRATLSSPDRSNELHAAVRLAHDHPVDGVGPGRVDLTWNVAQPQPTTMHEAYAHNEYLQTVDEAGVPGLILLLGGLGAVALAIRRSRRAVRINATAGGVAALVVFAVHSSFDFLWHIPLIPLTAAVIVGTLLPQPFATTTHGRVHQ